MDKMPIVLIFAMSMSVNLAGSIFRKIYTNKTDSKYSWQFFFVGITSLVALGVFLLWGGVGEMHKVTLFYGLLYGVVMAVQLVLYMLSVGTGSFAYSTMIISLGALLPGISGAIFWDEKLNAFNIAGIVLMVIALCLSAGKDSEKKKPSKIWLIYVFLAFFFALALGMVQKFHQETEYKGEINGFLVAAFISAAISMLAVFTFLFTADSKKFKKENPNGKVKTPFGFVFFLLILAAGVLIAVNNKFNLYLSGKVDSIVFFPMINGGAMVLNTLSSIFIFREKATVRMIAGLLIGTAAMILVCL